MEAETLKDNAGLKMSQVQQTRSQVHSTQE